MILILISITFICASTFNDSSQGDFSGTYNNTFWNSSGFIQVNSSNTSTVELFGNESGMVAYWRFNESSWDGTTDEVEVNSPEFPEKTYFQRLELYILDSLQVIVQERLP